MDSSKLLIILIIILIFLIIRNIVIYPKFDNNEGTCTKIKIDKCFVINLIESTDRYNKFIANYNSSIPLERIDGIDTHKRENVERYKSLVEPDKFNIMFEFENGKLRPDYTYFNPGALGCYLSHMEVYKKCFEQNLKYVIVFEDNVIMQKNFDNELDKALTNLGDDFDICFLNCKIHVGDLIEKCNTLIKKIKYIMSTKCYIINVENMKRYYELFYPIYTHIDIAHEKLVNSGANIYLINMNSIKVDSSNSTIKHSFVKSNKMGRYLPDKEFLKLQICQ
jgi:GR25 family glycosyltransferase involved in LPS biosynthesis